MKAATRQVSRVDPIPTDQQLHLSAGDDFEVSIEDEDTITLRRISRPPNHGLVDLLLACPSSFEISERETDDSALLEL